MADRERPAVEVHTRPGESERLPCLRPVVAHTASSGPMRSSLGGTVEAYYFGFGSDDFYLIADLPGNAAAAAGALTGGASGAINTRTIVLLTPEEVDAATKLSPSYRPPGA